MHLSESHCSCSAGHRFLAAAVYGELPSPLRGLPGRRCTTPPLTWCGIAAAACAHLLLSSALHTACCGAKWRRRLRPPTAELRSAHRLLRSGAARRLRGLTAWRRRCAWP